MAAGLGAAEAGVKLSGLLQNNVRQRPALGGKGINSILHVEAAEALSLGILVVVALKEAAVEGPLPADNGKRQRAVAVVQVIVLVQAFF